MTSAAGDPLIGRTIAQYEVVARLGGGGMGVVYAARDTRLGRKVALKFLPTQWSHDEGARQRFMREAQAASSTDHPNICTIHDIATGDDGQLFIVMAHYDGVTLKDRLESGSIPADDAVEIAAQVAEGLAKAHAQGVIHRDVKPGNLMLTEDGVKILDFGLAKFAEARLKLTLEGSTIGTVAYMSPEQARGDEADARSDVWAIGVVLYEMLAGSPPFKGGYPEAIAHAITTDTPPPLRAEGRDIPEALELLVFRALHKTPAVRFQTARDLARALRQLQGRTIPLDLRTEPVPTAAVQALPVPRPRLRTRKALAAGAVLALALIGAPLWILAPIERIPIAVAPIANHTGEPELDAYRLALTETLIDRLDEWPTIRVAGYLRVVEILRRFLNGPVDMSSRDALQSLAVHGGVQFIIVPSVTYRGGVWLAQTEIRNAGTGTNIATYETEGITSSLPRETASRLVGLLAGRIEEHFPLPRPRRWLPGSSVRTGGFVSLEAARAFEAGLNRYEQLEYASAVAAFTRVAEEDPLRAAARAWAARTLLLMGQEREAEAAAQRAAQLAGDAVPAAEAAFVDATLAETRRDSGRAEAGYRRLVELRPDDPLAAFELADFLRRQFRNEEAINAFHEVLRLDPDYVRPRVLLTQLYTRRNEFPLAEREARDAVDRYRTLGNAVGEAQALLYLAEARRIQGGAGLAEAAGYIEAARRIFESAGSDYNLARVFQFAGTVGFSSRNWAGAAASFERALEGARRVGNRQLEGTLLMNLGVTHVNLRRRRQALDYYAQSRDFYERVGDPRRAAQQEVNIAGLLVDHGTDQADVLRSVANARATLRKLGDVDFDLLAAQVGAASHRYSGRHQDAIRELRGALNIATERRLGNRIASLTVDIARSHLQLAEYAQAERLLDEVLASESAATDPQPRIQLARVYTRTGRFAAAAALLDEITQNVDSQSLAQFAPALHLARGELSYDTGRLDEASRHFAQGAALWTAELADDESIEARCYEAMLDATRGAAQRLSGAIAQAQRRGHLSLEARCRVHLARTYVGGRRFDEAVAVLDALPAEGDRTLGPELRSQVHHWRGRARLAAGAADNADDAATARTLVTRIRDALPPALRTSFSARTDIAAIQ